MSTKQNNYYISTNSVREKLIMLSENEIDKYLQNCKVKLNSLQPKEILKTKYKDDNDSKYNSNGSIIYQKVIAMNIIIKEENSLINKKPSDQSLKLILSRLKFNKKNLYPENFSVPKREVKNNLINNEDNDNYEINFNVDNEKTGTNSNKQKISKKSLKLNDSIPSDSDKYIIFLKEEDRQVKTTKENLNKLILIVNRLKISNNQDQKPYKDSKVSNSFSTEYNIDHDTQNRLRKSFQLWKSELLQKHKSENISKSGLQDFIQSNKNIKQKDRCHLELCSPGDDNYSQEYNVDNIAKFMKMDKNLTPINYRNDSGKGFNMTKNMNMEMNKYINNSNQSSSSKSNSNNSSHCDSGKSNSKSKFK